MQNPRLAIRYAKSLLDLAQEQGKLEEVFNDMKLLND
ncbi:MAG: F0F1 ATP synthase subunit delta, partial [Chitinophagaceae bacterium]